MAVDYTVQYPCQVRSHVPEPKLQVMVRYRHLARFAIEKAKAGRPGVDTDTIIDTTEVHIQITGPDGVAQERPVTIRELLKAVAPLDTLERACQSCPANVGGGGFGCFGKVNYPIARSTEEWLLARLPHDVKDPGLSMLFKFLTDVGVDGAPVNEIRQNARIFESTTPIVREWKGLFSRKTVDSSQILQMLVFSDQIKPPGITRTFAHLLNLGADHSDVPDSMALRQFKTFLRAYVVSARVEANLYVDG